MKENQNIDLSILLGIFLPREQVLGNAYYLVVIYPTTILAAIIQLKYI